MFPEAIEVVCDLDVALVVFFGVVAAKFVVVVGGDVAMKRRGSERERRGWGAGWDAVD